MSAVRTIRVEASTPYDVRFERGSLLQVGEAVQALGVREAVVVTDDTVRALYGQTAVDSLERAGVRAQCFSFAPGEDSKSLATYGALMEFLAESQLTRTGAGIWPGSRRPRTCAACALCRCPPRCWPWWIPPWAAKPR